MRGKGRVEEVHRVQKEGGGVLETREKEKRATAT